MARENYGFKKRQREQAAARKKQEKLARKAERANAARAEEPTLEGEAPPVADPTPNPDSTP